MGGCRFGGSRWRAYSMLRGVYVVWKYGSGGNNKQFELEGGGGGGMTSVVLDIYLTFNTDILSNPYSWRTTSSN